MNQAMKEKIDLLSAEKRRQLIDLTAAAADAGAAFEALKAAGFDVDEKAAAYLFDQINTPPVGELTDEELENVSGGCGGCSDSVCSHNTSDPTPL